MKYSLSPEKVALKETLVISECNRISLISRVYMIYKLGSWPKYCPEFDAIRWTEQSRSNYLILLSINFSISLATQHEILKLTLKREKKDNHEVEICSSSVLYCLYDIFLIARWSIELRIFSKLENWMWCPKHE